MSAELGDVVIYKPSPLRASVQVVDQIDSDSIQPFHMAEADVWLSSDQFLNVNMMARYVTDLNDSVNARFEGMGTGVIDRIDGLATRVVDLSDRLDELDKAKPRGKR